MTWYPKGWASSGIDPRTLRESAIDADRWDTQTADQMWKVTGLRQATKKLKKIAPTGAPLMTDAFLDLFKLKPVMPEPTEMQPTHLINWTVVSQFRTLGEREELRRYTRGSDVDAAMATVSVEPTLETLFDRESMKQRQEQAEKLQQQMQQLAEARDQERDLEEIIADWTAEHPDEEMSEDLAAQRAALAEMLEQLAEAAEAAAAELDDGLTEELPAIRAAVCVALAEAADDARTLTQMALTCGIDRGELTRMPVETRMELAKRIDNPRTKELAKRVGAFRYVAFSEQRHKVSVLPDEIVRVSIGRDLSHVLPSELAKLRHPLRKREFFRQYAEGSLLIHELEGTERLGKGGIHLLRDGSGSMSGDKDLWAASFAGALLSIARKEKREFHHLMFGSEHEQRLTSFVRPADYSIERIFDVLGTAFFGGTHFMAPLTQAITALDAEHRSSGRITGDIVMVTDGEAGVTDQWEGWFRAEQRRLDFSVFALVIGHPKTSEPLWSLTDGKCWDIRDLMSPADARPVFRAV